MRAAKERKEWGGARMGGVITSLQKVIDNEKEVKKRPVIPGEVEKTIALGQFRCTECGDTSLIFSCIVSIHWIILVPLANSDARRGVQHAPASSVTRKRPSSTCSDWRRTATGAPYFTLRQPSPYTWPWAGRHTALSPPNAPTRSHAQFCVRILHHGCGKSCCCAGPPAPSGDDDDDS